MSEARTNFLIRCLAFVLVFLPAGLSLAQTDHHSDERHETHDESMGDDGMHDGMHHDDMHPDDMSDGGMEGDDMQHDGMHGDMHHDDMGDDAMGMDHDEHAGEMPADLDFSTRRKSENGHFVVSYETNPEVPQLNQMHAWTLHIEDVHGSPVEDAQVMIAGDMPQHGHGLPTEPRVTQNLGKGDYLVEGMKFQMPGWWVVEFMVHSGGMSDSVEFNLMAR